MNADAYISSAHQLIHNGMAVFRNWNELDGLQTPVTLTMTLLTVCVQGEISATVDLDVTRMKAGSIMVLRRGHVINDITSTSDFKGFFILVDDARLDAIMPLSASYLASYSIYFRDDPVVYVSQAEINNLWMMHSLLTQKQRTMAMPYNQLTINSLCEALFYETLGIYTSMMSKSQRIPSRREELLSRFIDLVDNHFRENRSVSFFARQLHLSPKHLSAVVKSASGMSAGDWIDRKVILEAKWQLRNTPKTIQQISSDLNFSNQSFFGKFFKHLTGMTPREFRANPSQIEMQ